MLKTPKMLDKKKGKYALMKNEQNNFTHKKYGRHQNHIFLYMRPHANNMNLKSFFFFSYCLAYIQTTLKILCDDDIITLYDDV